MLDPFRYIAPNETTAPKHAAIRASATAAHATCEQVIGGGTWLGEHMGHYSKEAAFAAINTACQELYAAILTHAPASADRAAAERCCRLARMAANEAVNTDERWAVGENSRRCRDNLIAARWQACAAIALHNWE